MTATLFTSVLLGFATALSIGDGVTPTTTPATTTQTLTLRADEGQLLLDGAPCGDTTLVLHNAHVATRAEADAYSVALPDGRVFYKGDFTLRAQSRIGGTVEVEVCHGEAVVSPADVEPFAAAKQAKPVVRYVDGPA